MFSAAHVVIGPQDRFPLLQVRWGIMLDATSGAGFDVVARLCEDLNRDISPEVVVRVYLEGTHSRGIYVDVVDRFPVAYQEVFEWEQRKVEDGLQNFGFYFWELIPGMYLTKLLGLDFMDLSVDTSCR